MIRRGCYGDRGKLVARLMTLGFVAGRDFHDNSVTVDSTIAGRETCE